ncbi:MAG: hypothetical protein HXX13_10080 [Bacteroidetes bacterium]|nr:hypothetical protein [Bacteroidota bacterium]
MLKTTYMSNPFTIIVLVLFIFSNRLSSQNIAGTLDLTFQSNGKAIYDKDQFDVYQDVKVQPDGKIVAVGSSMGLDYIPYIMVTRYLENGNFDTAFGVEGHYSYSALIEDGAYKCLIRDNGKILIGGYSTNYTNWGALILQLNPDGTPDPTFGNFGVSYIDLGPGEDMVSAMQLLEDGKVLIAGYSENNEFKKVPVVARLTETGSLDTAFGTAGIAQIPVTEIDNEFSALCIQPDGKIVAAGHISNGTSWFSLLIARFDQDGNLDTAYGSDGIVNMNLNNVDDEFFDMNITETGEAILTGFTVSQTDYYYHLLVMKFDTTGKPVASFGDAGKVIMGNVPYTFGDAMMLQTDGKILVAGCTGELLPGNNDWALWRFNPDGSPDESFGTLGLTTTEFFGNADEALGIALYNDKIILAGKTRNATNYLDFAIARYTNDTEYHLSVPDKLRVNNFSISPNPVKRNSSFILELNDDIDRGIRINLIDMKGNTTVLKPIFINMNGTKQVKVKLPGVINAGIYNLRISCKPNLTETCKLVVID